MARKATKEELEIAARLDAALKEEEQDGGGDESAPPAAGPAPLALESTDAAPPEAERRRPGRPKGSGSKATESLLHEAVGGGAAPGAASKAPRSKTGPKKGMDAATMGTQIVGIHQLAVMFTGIGELLITPEEGRNLADAVVGVCSEYDLNIDGKTGAAIQLFAALAVVYTPRIMQIRYRVAMEKQANEQVATAAVPAN